MVSPPLGFPVAQSGALAPQISGNTSWVAATQSKEEGHRSNNHTARLMLLKVLRFLALSCSSSNPSDW
ncbi:unnamed protein product [Menidia menidia]|uniref:(Atlantic silverside) hypothetical protein n=1 Tax=Menidia menidia TaxID=238744 RepID=A0A8S4ABL4_9TELE|nr:unnamed protein product [Menidia menidia]